MPRTDKNRTDKNTTAALDPESKMDLRKQLIAEITGLERRLEAASEGKGEIDHSTVQTYKEMIHGRRELLRTIPYIN